MRLIAFCRNLNVFLAAFFAATSAGGGLLTAASMVALSVLPRPLAGSPAAAVLLPYLLVPPFLWWMWQRHRLSFAAPAPGAETRLRTGHGLLFAANVGSLAWWFFVWTPRAASGIQAWMPALAGALTMLVEAATLLTIAGLVLVWTARRRGAKPASAAASGFAQTIPAGRGRVQPPKRPSRWPSMLGALLGLVVSCGVLALAFAFLLAGLHSARQLGDLAAAAIGATAVTWLALVLFLLWTDRRGAALAVAWAPALVTVGVSAMSQAVFAGR